MNNNEIIKQIHSEFKTSIHNEVENTFSVKQQLKNTKQKLSELENVYLQLNQIGISSKQSNLIHNKYQTQADLAVKINGLESHLNFIQKISEHGYKVIGYKQIDKILKKWNLYISNAINYRGDIPTETAKKIIEFKNKDIPKLKYDKRELNTPILSKFIGSDYYRNYTDSNFYVIANLKEFKPSSKKDGHQHFIGNEIIYQKQINFEFPKLEKQLPDPVVLHPAGNSPSGEPYFYIIDLWGPEANIPDFSSDNV